VTPAEIIAAALAQYDVGHNEALDARMPGIATPDWTAATSATTKAGHVIATAADNFELLVEHQYRQERARREARRRLDSESRPTESAPVIETLDDLIASADDDHRPRIEGLLHEGQRAMLVAQFKAGKTTLIGNLIRSLVDGDPFLGRFATTAIAGRVAVLDFEMSKGQLKTWLRDQGIRRRDAVRVIRLRGKGTHFDIREAGVRAAWAARLRAAGVAFVILDCVRPLLDALGLNEHSEGGLLLTAFDALLAEAGIEEGLVVHHSGHQEAVRARGDSRFRDWPDAEWRLVRESEDPASTRFFSAFGRDVEVTEQRLDYDAVTRHLTIAGGSRRDQAAEQALDDVLALLQGDAIGLSGRGIQDRLKEQGISHARSTVLTAIKLGIAAGRIVTASGDRNAVLHKSSAPVRGSAPECAGTLEEQCASVQHPLRVRTGALDSTDTGSAPTPKAIRERLPL